MCGKYNGWANYETWVVNLWYDDHFNEEAEQCYEEAEPRYGLNRAEAATCDLADVIRDYIMEYENVPEQGLSADLLNAALSSVNWNEIAEGYIDNLVTD